MCKILTIVIPSYNVEDTLEKAVTSLMIPDKKLRESLDVLIVNDGSVDGTLDLARRFERQYEGIVRVWDKENGGHGSTVNVGMEQALGKYMKVVDGDDWLDTAALEIYLKILQSTDADMVATDAARFYMGDQAAKSEKSSSLPYDQMLDFDDIWQNFIFGMRAYAVKTDLLRNQPWRLNEDCYYVDCQLDLIAAMAVRTILYVNLELYVYCLQRPGQSISAQGLLKHNRDCEKIMDAFIQWHHAICDDKTVSENKMRYFEFFAKAFWAEHYNAGTQFNKEQRSEFLKQLRAYDEHLAKADEQLYAATNQKNFVFLCRLFHYSPFAYAILDKTRKVRWKLRHFHDREI